MARRPNILFIMADQLAPQVLPAYGHPSVRTPHLDRLAEEGVVFENACCNFPLCAPARFSMLSGRLPSRIGAFDNAVELPASVPTFNHYLRLAGYRTCLSGKMHFVGPDQLHGYEERVTTDVYPADFLWTPDWRLDDETWLEWYHDMSRVLDVGPHRRSVNVAYDDEAEFEAVRWLHEHADGDDDRPFALTVSFISPHDPYLAPPRWWEEYADVEIDPPRVAEHRASSARATAGGGWPSRPSHVPRSKSRTSLPHARRLSLRPASYIDAKVGRLPGNPRRDRRGARHPGRVHGRPRRLARRARPVLQDVVLRMVGPGAPDRACAVRVRPAAGARERLPPRSLPDAARSGGRWRPAGACGPDRRPIACSPRIGRRGGLAGYRQKRSNTARACARPC